MSYLYNKTALVTGASSGIGYEIVKYISQFDMQIIVTARREENLKKLKDEIESNSKSTVLILIKDLSDPKSPQEIYNYCKEKNSGIDLLENNARHDVTQD